MFAEEVGGDLLWRLLLDIDPRVERLHGGVVEPLDDRIEQRGELRMALHDLLTHHRGSVVEGEVLLVVLQHAQLEILQAAVGGVDEAEEHLAVLQRGVDQPGVHLADVVAGEVQAVQLAHGAEAVGAAGELRVHGEQVGAPGLGLLLFGEHPREIADALDAQALGLFLGHGQGIGVVEAGRLQPDQALGFVELLDPAVGSRGVELLVDVVVDDQRRAGVLPDDIQLAAFLGGAGQGAAQPGGDRHVVAALLQELRGDGGEDALLGEGLAADAQGFRLRQAGGEQAGAGQAE